MSKKLPSVEKIDVHQVNFCSNALVKSCDAIIYRLNPGLVCATFSQEIPSLAAATSVASWYLGTPTELESPQPDEQIHIIVCFQMLLSTGMYLWSCVARVTFLDVLAESIVSARKN